MKQEYFYGFKSATRFLNRLFNISACGIRVCNILSNGQVNLMTRWLVRTTGSTVFVCKIKHTKSFVNKQLNQSSHTSL